MEASVSAGFSGWKSPGFCFKYWRRNELLNKELGYDLVIPTRTGTTSVGIAFSDGVVLGTDCQNVQNNLRDPDADKLHYLADNIFSGIAADNYWVSRLISSELKLLQLDMNRKCRVISAIKFAKQILFQYQGFLDVNMIVGGVDIEGPRLTTIYPHGSSDKLLYSAIGSGSMPAMSVLENKYKVGLNEEEALNLLVDSTLAGIYNDLNSGTAINAVVIRGDGFSQRSFDVEAKVHRPAREIVKSISVAKTEIKRYKLVTVDEKILK